MRCHADDSSLSTAGDRTITAILTDESVALIVRAATKKQEDELEALREEVRQLRLEMRRSGEQSDVVESPSGGGRGSNGPDIVARPGPPSSFVGSFRSAVSSHVLDDDASSETICAIVREELHPVIAALANLQKESDEDAPHPEISRVEGNETKLDGIHGSLGDRMTTLDEAISRIEIGLQGIEVAIQASIASQCDILDRPEAGSQDVRAVGEDDSSDEQEIMDALQNLRVGLDSVRRDAELSGANVAVPEEASLELLSAGVNHSLAHRNDGTIKAWGSNVYGQVSVPAGLRWRWSSVKSVSAGEHFSLALKTHGTIAAWGRNDYGQSTVPSPLSAVTKVVAGGAHSLALLANKKVVSWGYNEYGQTTVPAKLENVRDIAAGAFHSLALLENGTVTGWGWNEFGQATVPADLEEVKAIAAGYDFSLALKNDGTVVAWGIGPSSNVPIGVGSVKALSAKYWHSLALLRNGTVEAWGENIYGETDVPRGLESVVAVAAGFRYSLAMKADGSVVGWGRNYNGDVPEEHRVP